MHEIVELRILAAQTHCMGENTSVKWTCSMTGRSVSGKEGNWNTSRNGLICPGLEMKRSLWTRTQACKDQYLCSSYSR